jgi:hypothetical protein
VRGRRVRERELAAIASTDTGTGEAGRGTGPPRRQSTHAACYREARGNIAVVRGERNLDWLGAADEDVDLSRRSARPDYVIVRGRYVGDGDGTGLGGARIIGVTESQGQHGTGAARGGCIRERQLASATGTHTVTTEAVRRAAPAAGQTVQSRSQSQSTGRVAVIRRESHLDRLVGTVTVGSPEMLKDLSRIPLRAGSRPQGDFVELRHTHGSDEISDDGQIGFRATTGCVTSVADRNHLRTPRPKLGLRSGILRQRRLSAQSARQIGARQQLLSQGACLLKEILSELK